MRRSAFSLFLLSLVGTLSLVQDQWVLGENAADAPEAPSAPAFTLENHDGGAISLSDYAGKIVVLEWFNEKCPVSREHHSTKKNTMVELARKYADKDVVWLAVNSTGESSNESNAAAATKMGIEYPILNDSQGGTGKAYGARTTPHMFVIGKDGAIAYRGAIDDRSRLNYVDQALAELLAGKPVSVPETKPYGCGIKYRR